VCGGHERQKEMDKWTDWKKDDTTMSCKPSNVTMSSLNTRTTRLSNMQQSVNTRLSM